MSLLNKLIQFIFVVWLILLSGCSDLQKASSDHGNLVLEDWDFEKDGVVGLKGEWDFYWKQLLEPGDSALLYSESKITLPGVWNDRREGNKKLDGNGYATFRLKINMPHGLGRMGLRIPFHFTSYKLWVNGKVIDSNGVVGTDAESAVPQTVPKYVYFDVPEDRLELILHISNYSYTKGGAPAMYKLGTEKQIRQMRTRRIAFDLILTGSLFIMALYHISFFLLRRKEISPLYFGLLCFLFMLRTICLGETYLIETFPNFNFELYTKLIFIGLFIGPAFFILFIEHLFPEESNSKIGRFYLIIGLLFSVTLLFPATVSTQAIVPFQLIVLSTLIYLMYILIRAVVKKREGAAIALVGTLVFIGTAINDILFDNQLINSDYLAPYGLFVFIFCQSFLLSFKFSRSFTSIENLSVRIQRINKANSRFVPLQFLSFLGKESVVDVQLGDNVTKNMTIFFADIRSFTSISEGLTPEENFNFLNNLLKRFSPIVRKNNGFIDKFMGDSIMALFPDNPRDGLLTARDVLRELEEYNENRVKGGLMPVKLGIGINTGSLMLGTIGEEERMDGTVISDSVNLASRLEGLTKTFGVRLIISENVLSEVKDVMNLEYRFLGEVIVKGKSKSVPIYDVFSFDSEEIKEMKRSIKEEFEMAIDQYQNENFDEAMLGFSSALRKYPQDKSSKYYLNKIEIEKRMS